jgi:type VI protein secretion system component VasK
MNDFGDWIWLTLWWFLFIAYLIILFQILSDLFRDRDTSGWAKAVWVLALLFVPFLTALIYLIARGQGMAERQRKDIVAARQETDAYIRDVAGASSSPAARITEAKALLDQGVITQDEFNALKAKALA